MHVILLTVEGREDYLDQTIGSWSDAADALGSVPDSTLLETLNTGSSTSLAEPPSRRRWSMRSSGLLRSMTAWYLATFSTTSGGPQRSFGMIPMWHPSVAGGREDTT